MRLNETQRTCTHRTSLSPLSKLLVEKTYFIGTEFTDTAYAICWLSVVISIHHFSKNVLSQQQK